MDLQVDCLLPRSDDIDGVPDVFLLPQQKDNFEQLNLTPKNPKYTLYQQRIRECLAVADRFIDKYKDANGEDFASISSDVGKHGSSDPFVSDLMVACFNELEREYLKRLSTP